MLIGRILDPVSKPDLQRGSLSSCGLHTPSGVIQRWPVIKVKKPLVLPMSDKPNGEQPSEVKQISVQLPCFPTFQPRLVRVLRANESGLSSRSLPNVSFQRLSQPNSEITATISTIAAALK